ncbi:MAG: twin-arginine translocase TatA/TatE family subunit [Candidatus Acidiferrales bacterium]
MLSLPHLIIVFVVALVVFGPEKMPELARNVGKFMAEFRRMTGEFKSTFEGHMRELEREADERQRPAPPPAPAPPAENSIRGDSTGASAEESTLPALKPAEGIVTAADPRVVHEAPAPESSNGTDEASSDISTSNEDGGDTPEPVTDGQHYPD